MIKELSDNIRIPLSNIEDPAQLKEVSFSSVLVKTHTKKLKPANKYSNSTVGRYGENKVDNKFGLTYYKY